MSTAALTPFDSWILGLGADPETSGALAPPPGASPVSAAASDLVPAPTSPTTPAALSAISPAGVSPPARPWVVGGGGGNGREELLQELQGIPATIIEAPAQTLGLSGTSVPASVTPAQPLQTPQTLQAPGAVYPPGAPAAADWRSEIRALWSSIEEVRTAFMRSVQDQSQHIQRLVRAQTDQKRMLEAVVNSINDALGQIGANQKELRDSMQGEVEYLSLQMTGLGFGMDLSFSQAMYATYRNQETGHHVSALNGRVVPDEEQDVVGRWVSYYGQRAQALQQQVHVHNVEVKAAMEEREKRKQEMEARAGDGQSVAPVSETD